MLEQKGERAVDRRSVDQMIVVEHEHKVIGQGGEIIEQGREDRFQGRQLGSVERARDRLTNWRFVCCRRPKRLQRSDEVDQKARRVAVAFVQGKPGDWIAECGVRRAD